MNAVSIQVTYRKGQPIAAYIYLNRRPGEKVARTEEVQADLLIDYSGDGRPVGIEIITPGAVSVEDINWVFDRLGLGRPDADARSAPRWVHPGLILYRSYRADGLQVSK